MPPVTSPYIELHACSAFSFLQGASNPEEVAAEAARLEYPALALVDRDGVYGAPRFYRACRETGVRPLVGAAVTLPEGELPLLVATAEGYRNLCRLITRTKLRSSKGEGAVGLDELRESSAGLIALTGGHEGPLVRLLQTNPSQAPEFLRRLQEATGPGQVYCELQRHFDREQERINQAIVALARPAGLPLVATNGVRFAARSGRLLHDVLTCIRHHTQLTQAGRLLNRNGERHLKAPAEMARIFADLPEAIHNSAVLAERLEFTLRNLGYRFPDYPLPPGTSQISHLRKLTYEGARKRYRPFHERARNQIEHELNLIEKLDLAGYFLIVRDIVEFCQHQDILVQGRGSAANSAVCYSLEITAVDPVGMDLLFERFLSEERGEWPDIDLDLPSGDQREQVIQHVYAKYGRHGAAMTANVITYRGKSAAREVGKAFGIPPEVLDRLSRLISSWGVSSHDDDIVFLERFKTAGLDPGQRQVRQFLRLWKAVQNLPRHLGQHSGGMVICGGRLDEVVPLENARMNDRSVVQWDKDDCADLGIIKVDLLGLGMMAALQEAIRLVHRSGGDVDLAHLPPDDPAVYDLLRRADTVGVFQVESRAQMATLPRLKPRCFYDLVVEVAIIRPGPIVGEMVHPYLRRREGTETVTYPHPSLEPILKRTLGVPLFQEQLLRIAMVAAGFSGGEAEELRRALGFKRPDEAMQKVEAKLRDGLARNGIHAETAATIVKYITSFALYGFPESHAASFALLAYASAYLKTHHPAEFYTALLNHQPMGFYHPATLVKDAQHRGQRVRPIDIRCSDWFCDVEPDRSIRLGLRYVHGLRREAGMSVVEERRRRPFASLEDLCRRTGLNKREVTQLASIGALNGFGMKRREALWQVEQVWRRPGPLLEDLDEPDEPSPLRDMTAEERLQADYAGAGLTTGPHPMALLRPRLAAKGVRSAAELTRFRDGIPVTVGGMVIVRQRPGTAKGFLFLSLEDETGIANIIIRPQLFARERPLLMSSPFLLIDGNLQNQNGVVSVKAGRVRALE